MFFDVQTSRKWYKRITQQLVVTYTHIIHYSNLSVTFLCTNVLDVISSLIAKFKSSEPYNNTFSQYISQSVDMLCV